MNQLVEVLNVLSLYAPKLVGFALPPLVSYLNVEVKKDWERLVVAGLVCFLVAAITQWRALTAYDLDSVLSWATIVFAESQYAYRLYFKDSWLEKKIEGSLLTPPTSELSPVQN